jgi:nucleoside-diphosphate-sugar epimerase
MHNDANIFVAVHTGLLGSAFVRKLKNDDYRNIITKTHKELDLANQLLSFFLSGVSSTLRGWDHISRMWCEMIRLLFGDICV